VKLVIVATVLACLFTPAPRAHATGAHANGRALAAAAGRAGLRTSVLDLALQAYECGRRQGEFRRPLLTVIDYSRPSSEPRLWVLDLARGRVLFRELVAHGQNSGEDFAWAFSNAPGSRQSSLGLFRTEQPYVGQHGQALRLSGLEAGFNDRAEDRAVVIHGADYVSAEHVARHGRLGRSWGCPALPLGVHHRIIEAIAEGSAVFAYYPDPTWLRQSTFLHCGGSRLVRR